MVGTCSDAIDRVATVWEAETVQGAVSVIDCIFVKIYEQKKQQARHVPEV